MKWVEVNNIFDDEDDLEIFAKMKYRGEDFDSITLEKLEKRLPEGPAMRLFNAMQELIRSKDERGHIIYFYLSSHAVASFLLFMLFVCCCSLLLFVCLLFLLSFILSCCG